MASAYYNENDPFAAAWLRRLIEAGEIAPGVVDERSIVDVQPQDLSSYTQCHFFAGIGGWSLALRFAGWPDDRPVWTGSCPCQPGTFPLAHGLPARMGRLRAYGNAIVPQVAAAFIDAFQGAVEDVKVQ